MDPSGRQGTIRHGPPWRSSGGRGEVASFELSDLIHAFHQGPSRDLFVRYTSRPHDPAVTYAIATGIIDRRDVPDELLEHLARALEFYAHAPCEE